MRLVRLAFRLLRLAFMFYTVWRGSRGTRILWIVRAVWRIIRRKPKFKRLPKMSFTFVGPFDKQIYRRMGWRRLRTRN